MIKTDLLRQATISVEGYRAAEQLSDPDRYFMMDTAPSTEGLGDIISAIFNGIIKLIEWVIDKITSFFKWLFGGGKSSGSSSSSSNDISKDKAKIITVKLNPKYKLSDILDQFGKFDIDPTLIKATLILDIKTSLAFMRNNGDIDSETELKYKKKADEYLNLMLGLDKSGNPIKDGSRKGYKSNSGAGGLSFQEFNRLIDEDDYGDDDPKFKSTMKKMMETSNETLREDFNKKYGPAYWDDILPEKVVSDSVDKGLSVIAESINKIMDPNNIKSTIELIDNWSNGILEVVKENTKKVLDHAGTISETVVTNRPLTEHLLEASRNINGYLKSLAPKIEKLNNGNLLPGNYKLTIDNNTGSEERLSVYIIEPITNFRTHGDYYGFKVTDFNDVIGCYHATLDVVEKTIERYKDRFERIPDHMADISKLLKRTRAELDSGEKRNPVTEHNFKNNVTALKQYLMDVSRIIKVNPTYLLRGFITLGHKVRTFRGQLSGLAGKI